MAVEKRQRKAWLLRSGNDHWQIVRRMDASPDELRSFESRTIQSFQLQRALSDPLSSPVLLEIRRELVPGSPTLGSIGTDKAMEEVRREVEKALARNDLVLIPAERPRSSESAAAPQVETSQEPAQPRPAPAPIAEKSWIEIVLKDRRGRPVPRQRFRIVLPDGSVVEGRLDENGRARKESIDPGMCTISFPDLGRQQS